MREFSLRPVHRVKQNTPFDWVFEYSPYKRVDKLEVVKRILLIYPDLVVKRVHVVKSLKRILVILSTDRKSPWAST